MKVHIITIFPESFQSYFSSSIIGKSIEKGFFEPVFYKLNDFSEDNFKRVDNKAYGMHGQVISPEPLSKAIKHVFKVVGSDNVPIVFLSPDGDLLKQNKVEQYREELCDEFIIICGHYEGIDQRIIDLYVTHKVSIGEYVLSSGELATQVFLDSIVRTIPGVLGNNDSLEDSFSDKLNGKKEYPVYTRPEVFEGKSVPEVLLSGNHAKIEEWKKQNLS